MEFRLGIFSTYMGRQFKTLKRLKFDKLQAKSTKIGARKPESKTSGEEKFAGFP